jgi:hypothetical protein
MHKEKPTFKAGVPAVMPTTLKKPHKFSLGPMYKCKHHSQYKFPDCIGRHSKCIHRKDKVVMRSNKEPSSMPQALLTTFSSVDHSSTTFDAVLQHQS